jgi:hypothetical protein
MISGQSGCEYPLAASRYALSTRNPAAQIAPAKSANAGRAFRYGACKCRPNYSRECVWYSITPGTSVSSTAFKRQMPGDSR